MPFKRYSLPAFHFQKTKSASGIATTVLPHRFQEIAPGVFLDGAHNPAAARVLANTIKSEFPGEKVDFVIGMLKGKDIKGTLDELLPVAESFTFITFPHKEAASGDELLEKCNHYRKKVVEARRYNYRTRKKY